MPHISHEGPQIIDRCPDTVALHVSSTLQAVGAFPSLALGFHDPLDRAKKFGTIISARARRIETFDPTLEIVLAKNKLDRVMQFLSDASDKIPGPLGDAVGVVYSSLEAFPNLPEKS